MICISLKSESVEQLKKDIAAASQMTDVIEIRLDYLPLRTDLEAIIAERPRPLLVCCRRVQDGGLYDGDERVRMAALIRASEQGADFIDVEYDTAHEITDVPSKRIVSYHDFRSTPEALADIHGKLMETKPDIIKIAVLARSITDNLRVFELLRSTDYPTAAFCMGELGMISRIAGRKFGSRLTYASLSKGSETAPGQLPAEDLRTIYHYATIGDETDIYGVIANPVAHSMSPAIHNAAFQVTGLDAVYLPFKVEHDPAEFVKAFKSIAVKGYSVTIPHKETVMPAMDEIDPVAQSIGAVNTIVNRDGRLYGANTDYIAAIGELEKVTTLEGKRALIVGAGGAARAIAFGLLSKGVQLRVADIYADKAKKLAEEVGCNWADMRQLAAPDADIILNASPVGMHPNIEQMPIPVEWLQPEMVVFDAVYNPIETKLLREARRIGCATATGFGMFVSQAVAQFEMWTGKQAPADVMAEVVRERLAQ